MAAERRTRRSSIALWPWLSAALVWTLLLAACVVFYTIEEDEHTVSNALVQARESLEKDLVYRRWASGHGGVYVPPTEKTAPNPWLEFIPDRDVVTTGGKRLTLVNPAYMTRQVHEMGAEQYGTKGHITSLNPIRPENAPDEWERRVLGEFAAAGIKEKWEIAQISGEPHLRLMRVLYAEKGCLKCHERQGYREGDVRGGLSTSVPLAVFFAASEEEKRTVYLVSAMLWLVGVAALHFMRRSVLAGTDALETSLAETVQSQTRYSNIFSHMLDGYAVCGLETGPGGEPEDYRYLAVNPAFEALFGVPAAKLVGHAAREAGGPPDHLARFAEVVATGAPTQFEEWVEALGKHIEIFAYRTGEGEFAFVARDLTARKRAEEERERLSAQLVQAQKMEAIGKLAGGVAHDFNNMLGVILGNAELALIELQKDDPRREHLVEITAAATRSSEITRQLLAFARKQTVAPKVLDLNDSLEGMLKMIRRLIGEDIDLAWNPRGDLWRIKIDPSQLDQLMANLATNARDAIEGVGKLTIETDNATIDADYARTHEGFTEGRYAVLTVSDDGSGIEREKLSAIFEPFFTTKEKGKGTGLGLSTVYGIVKQNGGFINVYSEPGSGATFRIYLPAVDEAETASESREEAIVHGTETVLLVEDELSILKLTTKYLRTMGYHVLPAGTVAQAEEIARTHQGEISLLLTDVVMPEMNGRALYDKLREIIPNLKCLYMSGYTANVIAHRGVLDEGVNFIGKPFGMGELGKKVRSALTN